MIVNTVVATADTCESPLFCLRASTLGRPDRLRVSRHHVGVVGTRCWARVRRDVLDRDGWRCVACGWSARMDRGHIVPLDRGGDPWDPANRQGLCRSCHITETREERRHRPARVAVPLTHGRSCAARPPAGARTPSQPGGRHAAALRSIPARCTRLRRRVRQSVTGGVSVKQALTARGLLDVRRPLFSFALPSGSP